MHREKNKAHAYAHPYAHPVGSRLARMLLLNSCDASSILLRLISL